MEFLKLLRRMEQSTICQVVMATHSPMLMAYPNARLLRLSKYGLDPVTVEQTDHYKVMREFCDDPAGFVEAVMEERIVKGAACRVGGGKKAGECFTPPEAGNHKPEFLHVMG